MDSFLDYQKAPPVPATYGYGVLAAGDRVRFVGDYLGASLACSILKVGNTYTVRSCEWICDRLRLRLAEQPGYAFQRSLFGSA